MERDTKIVIGITAVGVGAGIYFYLQGRKSGASKPLSINPTPNSLRAAQPGPSSAPRFDPTATPNDLGGSDNTRPGASVTPSGLRYASALRPVTFSSSSGGYGGPPPAPMPSNYVQTPKGIFTWPDGGSFSSGIISNVSNGNIAIVTPQGALTMSPGMTYNVTTGEFRM